MRAVPRPMPASAKTRPKAMEEATPEQNTKISVASEKPNRAGMKSAKVFQGMCANRMMNMPAPRKTSRRGSRGRRAGMLRAGRRQMRPS